MDLQAIFGFEDIFALFTLETSTFNYLFDSFFCRNVFISRRIFQFLLQKLGSSSETRFFFRNSVLLLAFLRKVDGVFFFLVLPWVARA